MSGLRQELDGALTSYMSR